MHKLWTNVCLPLKIDKNKEYWEGKAKGDSAVENQPLFLQKMFIIVDQKEQLQVKDFSSSLKAYRKLLPSKESRSRSFQGVLLHELEQRG